jgi:ribonuclease HI
MKKKYYVVWKGHQRGVFETWDECQKQVKGYPSPEYKSFPTLIQAQAAFEEGSAAHLVKRPSPMKTILDTLYEAPIVPSMAVDGAFSSSTKLSEYQGVNTETKAVIFKCGPFLEGTNNIMEFLALVHALALCKEKRWLDLPIYSDSMNAIKWVKAKKARTYLVRTPNNELLFDLIRRAEKWLNNNVYTNPVLKWETKVWGEIPADFGRK